jgi:hypothetical protein
MSDLQQTFRDMCEKHDLTYTYSDDGRTYSKGEAEYKAIVEFSKKIPREMAVKIWNETVEKKMQSFVWDEYKWK